MLLSSERGRERRQTPHLTLLLPRSSPVQARLSGRRLVNVVLRGQRMHCGRCQRCQPFSWRRTTCKTRPRYPSARRPGGRWRRDRHTCTCATWDVLMAQSRALSAMRPSWLGMRPACPGEAPLMHLTVGKERVQIEMVDDLEARTRTKEAKRCFVLFSVFVASSLF